MHNPSRLFLINSKYSWITYVSAINYEIISISGTVGHCVSYVSRRQIVWSKPRDIMYLFCFWGDTSGSPDSLDDDMKAKPTF